MDETNSERDETSWGRTKTALFLAIGGCWLGLIMGIFGATVLSLLIGVFFMAAAIGLQKRREWAGTLGLVLTGSLGLIELISLLVSLTTGGGGASALHIAQPLGHLLRLFFHFMVFILLLLSKVLWKGESRDSPLERGGAI